MDRPRFQPFTWAELDQLYAGQTYCPRCDQVGPLPHDCKRQDDRLPKRRHQQRAMLPITNRAA